MLKAVFAAAALAIASPAAAEIILDVDTQAQLMYVYDDDELIEVVEVSTGKEGKETPLGEYVILQKQVKHRSSIYGSSMPYMQRLTWDGIAIHAGDISRNFASHGCIRVASENAKWLYDITKVGTKVYVR